jgi:hypothetical protein
MGFLGTEGKFISHDNPYLDDLAGMGYEMGPARKYYKGILKGAQKGDYSNMPGMGMFSDAIASGYKDIENSADPLAFIGSGEGGGAMGDRIEQLQKERLRQGVNSQKFGFVQQGLSDAAGNLSQMWRDKNGWNLNKAGMLIGGENNRYQYQAPQQGWGSQLLNSAIQGGAAVGSAFAGKSDERLKTDIRDTSVGLEDLKKIETKDYEWKHGGGSDTGLIAQELHKVYPQAVLVGGDDELTDPWMVDYGKLTPLLIKSVQELSQTVEALQAKINALEAQAIESKLSA